MRVVITTTRLGKLGQLLCGRGATVQHLPCLEIAATHAPQRMPTNTDWVVFTSVHAARFCASELKLELSARRVASVGASTTAALAQNNIRVDLIPSQANAQALTVALLQHHPKHVLFVCGTNARQDLPKHLRKAGVRVSTLVVYESAVRTLTAAEQLEIAHADAVLFGSPLALKAIATQPQGRVVAIGASTANAIQARGWRVAAIAASPLEDDVLQALLP